MSLLKRFAFDATRRRYRRTISSADAPVISFPPASMAAAIFSVIMSLASRRALLPPSISFASRNPITRFASTASINASNVRRLFPNRFMTPPVSLPLQLAGGEPAKAKASATIPALIWSKNNSPRGKSACSAYFCSNFVSGASFLRLRTRRFTVSSWSSPRQTPRPCSRRWPPMTAVRSATKASQF